MRPKYLQKKINIENAYILRTNVYHIYISFSSTIWMKMFHTEYSWRPLKHLAYFVLVKNIMSVTRDVNFKCFEPESGMHF